MTRIRVIAPDGRFIPGYGDRAYGEVFELPDDVAARYLSAYPDDYEAAAEQGSAQEA